jgi:predicted nucleic acid-binding Zn finger protein
MQGDVVKASTGFFGDQTTPIPIYFVAVHSENNQYVVNADGCVDPKFIGGVKPGSVGKIGGHPCKAVRSCLKGYEKGHNIGNDYVMLFPVYWEHYKKVAWISQDHFAVTGSDPALEQKPSY